MTRWKDAGHDKWVGAHPSDTDADRGHFTGYVAVTIYTKGTARSITLTRTNARKFACHLLNLAGEAAPEDQAIVQLAGCLTAAEGHNQRPAKPRDYGYSLAYDKVLLLRRAFEKLAHGKAPQQVLDAK